MAWLWVAMLATICFGTGTITHWALLQHLGYALAGVDGLAWLIVGGARRSLEVSHAVDRSHATAGDEITEIYTLQRRWWWPALRVEIDGESEDGLAVSLPWRPVLQVTRRRRLPRRGRFHLGAGTVVIGDPFGLIRWPVGQVVATPVTVHPRPVAVTPGTLVSGMGRAGRRRAPGAVADGTLGNLRPYQIGDSPSRIHWRSTARSGTLLVAEPETEQRRTPWLLVDLGGGEETAERTAGMAAFLAAQLEDAGEAVGAIIAGHDQVVVSPRRGRDRREPLIEPLATVEASAGTQVERLARAAQRCIGPGSVLFLISPFPGAALVAEGLNRVAPVVAVASQVSPGTAAGGGA